jgi:hypothetical protein
VRRSKPWLVITTGKAHMQSLLRVLNIVLSPALTLYFSSRFQGLTIVGKDAGDVIGGTAAGLFVLLIEIALTQGPQQSVWLRRWLEPRAAFEGVWLQDVFEGQGGNAIGMFSLDYEREGDSFVVLGYAYTADGRPWAKWISTHMFIDKRGLKATYRWEGEMLDGRPTPEVEKSGLTELVLRLPPVFSLPLTGDGRVSHVGEGTRVKFRLRRVTNRLLEELGLPFKVRQLRINAHDEEARLVQAFLRQRDRRPAEQQLAAHT